MLKFEHRYVLSYRGKETPLRLHGSFGVEDRETLKEIYDTIRKMDKRSQLHFVDLLMRSGAFIVSALSVGIEDNQNNP